MYPYRTYKEVKNMLELIAIITVKKIERKIVSFFKELSDMIDEMDISTETEV